MNGNSRALTIIWVAISVIVYITGYTKGADSKQPYIDSLNGQVLSVNQQIDSLNGQITVLQGNVRALKAGCVVTLCNDGSCSFSTGSGTCSHHLGVDVYVN